MVSATITLASDAIAWIDRSMPPSMMTKPLPQASTNSVAVSPASCSSASGVRNEGCSAPTSAISSTSVTSGVDCRRRSMAMR